MPVSINGNGTINNVSLPTSGFGKVLQLVRATDSTNRSTTSTTMVDGSLSVTITPKQVDSKIFLFYTASITPTNGNYVRFQIATSANVAVEGAENCHVGDQTSTGMNVTTTVIGMHSPASTSAQTYKIRFNCNSGTATLQNVQTTGQLIAIEVAP